MSLWQFYFGWYQGAVYSNLIASGLCAGLVYWRARVHLRRQREAHDQKHAKTHELLESLHRRLDAVLEDHSDDLEGDG